MIEVDISNVWGELSLPDLLAMEKEVFDAHRKLTEDSGTEGQLPDLESTEELNRIRDCAERIRCDSEVCVVVGSGGSCLGARGAIELLQGSHRNLTRETGEPRIFFAGNSFSTRQWNELMQLLAGKDFSVLVISGPGADLERAIAFRSLRWMLERKYGTEEANSRIYAVTDPEQGALGQMAREAGWETFLSSGDSVLTAAGLLPLAVAGIDILEVVQGAMAAKEEYNLRSYENPVWLYAAVRNLLYRSGRNIELLTASEPDFRGLGSWWQRLFSGVGGPDSIPAEWYAAKQKSRFETLLRFAPCEAEHIIGSDWKDLDDLNFLEGKPLSFVEEQAGLAALTAHADSGMPVITLDCGVLNGCTLGQLFYFLQLSSGICACLPDGDPVDPSGAEIFEQNLFRLLGKPDSET